jgi:hypothetical protein
VFKLESKEAEAGRPIDLAMAYPEALTGSFEGTRGLLLAAGTKLRSFKDDVKARGVGAGLRLGLSIEAAS